jgi:hypothetical protein
MRLLLIGLLAMLLSGCDLPGSDNGRYQIVVNSQISVWRLDTKTGQIELCGVDPNSLPPIVQCPLKITSGRK